MLKEPVLLLSHLGKKYGVHWAVKDLNLTVFIGEIYGFLGRNGAGKTTTIRMITGRRIHRSIYSTFYNAGILFVKIK